MHSGISMYQHAMTDVLNEKIVLKFLKILDYIYSMQSEATHLCVHDFFLGELHVPR